MRLIALLLSLTLVGCGTVVSKFPDKPEVIGQVTDKTPKYPKPKLGQISVAVYSFKDLTGQRKPNDKIASFSSAVTQGGEAVLIKALQDVYDGTWFKVVERVGLDNLIKERQMIKQMREIYEGKDAKPLAPLMFAGLIIEGGIVSYDSNIETGGTGARIFGIGSSTQWRKDVVTVSIRAISVQSGTVLSTITTTKTVLSYSDNLSVLRFNELGTTAIETEVGLATNEPVNRAVQSAIEAAVKELINDGIRKGHWEAKQQ